jgi:hypothetical protein
MNKMEITDNLPAHYIRKMHRWRMAFFGVVILFAGIIIGGALVIILMPERIMMPPPGPEFEGLRILPLLRRDLDLSDEQVKKIEPILNSNMEKLRVMRESARVEIAQILEQMNSEISAVLTEEQKTRWQEGLDRLQREIRPRVGRRRGEGMGGPRRGDEMMGPRRGEEFGGPPRGDEFEGPVRGRNQQQRLRRGRGPDGSSTTVTEPNIVRQKTDGNTPE